MKAPINRAKHRRGEHTDIGLGARDDQRLGFASAQPRPKVLAKPRRVEALVENIRTRHQPCEWFYEVHRCGGSASASSATTAPSSAPMLPALTRLAAGDQAREDRPLGMTFRMPDDLR